METSGKALVASGIAPKRIIFTFCNLLCDKETKLNCGHQIIFPPCPKKYSNFSQFRLFLFVGPAKPLWSLAPASIAPNYGLQIQVFSVNL